MKSFIYYNGFLQAVYREFPSYTRCKQWLRQIGRSDLIPNINRLTCSQHLNLRKQGLTHNPLMIKFN